MENYEEAISPAMGIVLVVIITILLSAFLVALMFGSPNSGENFKISDNGSTVTPINMNENVNYEIRANGNVINIIHGDAPRQEININGLEPGTTVTILNAETKEVLQEWTYRK